MFFTTEVCAKYPPYYFTVVLDAIIMDIIQNFVNIHCPTILAPESVTITTKVMFPEVTGVVEFPRNRKIYHLLRQIGINWIVIDLTMLAASEGIKLHDLAMHQWSTLGGKKEANYTHPSKRCTITAPTL